MTKYYATITPPQLFIGTVFHEEREEKDEDGWPVTVEEYWEHGSIDASYAKLKEGIESLNAGIKCLDIQFGDYDLREGILPIRAIICEYDGGDASLLQTLLTDEAYISTGISCYSWDTSPMVAFYFKIQIEE